MKKLILPLLLSFASSAFAADICDGKAKDNSAMGSMALQIATFANLKPQIKDLLFNKCVSLTTTKEQVLPSAFYAQDAEVLNWYLQRGYDVAEEARSVSRGNILMYKIAAASAEKLTQPTATAQEAKELKEKYNIDMATLPYRQFNTPSDISLIKQLAQQIPEKVLNYTDNEQYNLLHYAIRFGQPDVIQIVGKRNSELYLQKNGMGYTPITMIWAKPCIDDKKRGYAAYTTFAAASDDTILERIQPNNMNGMAALEPNALDYAYAFKAENKVNELVYGWASQKMGGSAMAKSIQEVDSFKKDNAPAYRLFTKIKEVTDFCSRSVNP